MKSTLAALLLSLAVAPAFAEAPANLVKNADFMLRNADKKTLAAYDFTGDAKWQYLGDTNRDSRVAGIALRGTAGQVSQTVPVDAKAGSRWYHFSFRGLPDDGFKVAAPADLSMRVDFLSNHATTATDGKSQPLNTRIEQDRRDLAINGDHRTGGAAVWRTYAMDLYLPFETVDAVRLSVAFQHGTGSTANATFAITDFSLTPIEAPATATPVSTVNAIPAPPSRPEGTYLPLGGRWFYRTTSSEAQAPTLFTTANADRLYYHDAGWATPFAGVMSTTLRAGDLDLHGNLVQTDRPAPDNVTISFDKSSLILHTRGLPNHPTGKFPETTGGNPNYIQEQDSTYYLPLNPQPNPRHFVTTSDNSNHALNMGPIGVAANGVVFFNPFDMGNTDATSFMDRCCGHPNQDGLYHYHKYPVCINSPWSDSGKGHSPLLGWAFDGYPVYGPYEKAGVMAKDITGDGSLNGFNMEYDPERGWHYHVTPGRFPYIIGGYWGTPDARDVRRGPPGR